MLCTAAATWPPAAPSPWLVPQQQASKIAPAAAAGCTLWQGSAKNTAPTGQSTLSHLGPHTSKEQRQQLRRGAAEAEGQRQLAAAGHQLRQGGEWGVANTRPHFKPLTRVANALSASRQCLQQGAENERANRCGTASTRPQPASPCRCHRLRACPTDQSAARPHPGPGVSGKVGRSP